MPSAQRVYWLVMPIPYSLPVAEGRRGADIVRDDLVEELQALLLNVINTADEALEAAEPRRQAEVKAVTLNLLTERVRAGSIRRSAI
jgi:hypothetical protein